MLRTRFVQEWLAREGEVRLHQAELAKRIAEARASGDVANGTLLVGQDAGLIDAVEPAGDVVRRIVLEAEDILGSRVSEVLPADERNRTLGASPSA